MVVANQEGLHARPVMKFIDLASTFAATITVGNVTRGDETVNGKSAMQMLLLEATQGCVLRITARGPDAPEAIDALAALISTSFDLDAHHPPDVPGS